MPSISHEDWLKDTQHLLAGQRLVIEAKISGIPKPTVSWSYGDQPVMQNERVTIETRNGTTILTLNNVTLTESGSYKVKATNEVGNAEVEFKVEVKGEYLKISLIHFSENSIFFFLIFCDPC